MVRDDDFVIDTSIYHTPTVPAPRDRMIVSSVPISDHFDQIMFEVLQKKTIKNNFSFQTMRGTQKINLDEKWLYCRGWSEAYQRYNIIRVRLIKCHSKLFHGAHFIQIYGKAPEWYHSLSYFRKEVLKFEDSVSFERSCFYVDWDTPVVRLKYIRHLFQLPAENPPRGEGKQLSERCKLQIMKHIHNIHEIYTRDTEMCLDEDTFYELINEYYTIYLWTIHRSSTSIFDTFHRR